MMPCMIQRHNVFTLSEEGSSSETSSEVGAWSTERSQCDMTAVKDLGLLHAAVLSSSLDIEDRLDSLCSGSRWDDLRILKLIERCPRPCSVAKAKQDMSENQCAVRIRKSLMRSIS